MHNAEGTYRPYIFFMLTVLVLVWVLVWVLVHQFWLPRLDFPGEICTPAQKEIKYVYTKLKTKKKLEHSLQTTVFNQRNNELEKKNGVSRISDL